jgi:predicted Fe-Mo cluster-binding NifX family protein
MRMIEFLTRLLNEEARPAVYVTHAVQEALVRGDHLVLLSDRPAQGRLAIAVAGDSQKVFRGMLGGAAAFLIVDTDRDGREVARQLRANPYQKTAQHGKTFDVADLLADCQTLISRRIGRAGVPRMEARGFELIFTKQENVETALEEYLYRLFK